MEATAPTPCRIGESCHWDIVESRWRQARAPRPAPLPPDQRDPHATYDVDNLPPRCQANHWLLDTATVTDRGTVVCGACHVQAPKQPNMPVVPMEFATTGGRGLGHAAFERTVTTHAELLHNEQLTRYNHLRQQLARNQVIVWNNPTAAGEWYRSDLPQGIGIYVWPLTSDERHELVTEANELRQVLHLGLYDADSE